MAAVGPDDQFATMVSLPFCVAHTVRGLACRRGFFPSQAGMWTGEGNNLSVAGRWRVGVLIEQATDSLEVPLEVQTMRAAPMEPGHP